MSSEQKSSGSEQAELASYRIWEKLEQRLWSRARLILLCIVIGIVVIAVVGLPLVREALEQRVLEQARVIIAEQVATERLNLSAVRQEFREDTEFARTQFIAGSVEMEARLGDLIRRAEELQTVYAEIDERSVEIDAMKNQALAVHTLVKNEHERVHKLRTEYERELREFTDESERLSTNAPRVIQGELGRVEKIIERELDELRLVLADHMVGKPAMFSTYIKTDDRYGQLTGVNFGEKPGRVFMRVRAFLPTGGEPKAESDSIVLPVSLWGDSMIELRLTARNLEQIAEAEAGIADAAGVRTELRFGFMVQRGDGQMSQWSGLRADSIVPPERISAAVE